MLFHDSIAGVVEDNSAYCGSGTQTTETSAWCIAVAGHVASGLKVRRNKVEGTWGIGIFDTSTAAGTLIEQNTLEDQFGTGNIGIGMFGTQGAVVRNNTVRGIKKVFGIYCGGIVITEAEKREIILNTKLSIPSLENRPRRGHALVCLPMLED